MHYRRNIIAAMLAAVGGLAARAARAEASPDAAKVAYHLSDLDKIAFVLGNIRNHYEGMGGADKVTIALVVHGPALRAFHAAQPNAEAARTMGQLVKAGLQPYACVHTMRAQNVTVRELLPGFLSAERGAVVLLAELQARGYAYLRP